jgi:hypothetical protein
MRLIKSPAAATGKVVKQAYVDFCATQRKGIICLDFYQIENFLEYHGLALHQL